jgi:hypothetical protein
MEPVYVMFLEQVIIIYDKFVVASILKKMIHLNFSLEVFRKLFSCGKIHPKPDYES